MYRVLRFVLCLFLLMGFAPAAYAAGDVASVAAKVQAASAAPVSSPATLAECLVDMPAGTLICGSFFLLGEAKAVLNSADYRITVQ